jgi:hypothetical protein
MTFVWPVSARAELREIERETAVRIDPRFTVELGRAAAARDD